MTSRAAPDENTILQQAIFTLLLATHPAHWSLEELARALTQADDDFAAHDAAHTAIHDLYSVGLLHQHGDFVFLTRAATAAAEILE